MDHLQLQFTRALYQIVDDGAIETLADLVNLARAELRQCVPEVAATWTGASGNVHEMSSSPSDYDQIVTKP